jgi:hypothetical protein
MISISSKNSQTIEYKSRFWMTVVVVDKRSWLNTRFKEVV